MKPLPTIQSLTLLTGVTVFITLSNVWLTHSSSSRACVRSDSGNAEHGTIVCGEMVPLPSTPVNSFSSAIVSSTSIFAIQKTASLQSRLIQNNSLQNNPLQNNPLNESASQIITAHGFKFELKGCQQLDTRIICHLLIQNLTRTDRPLHLQAYKYPTHSRLISPTGEEFHADQIQFGQKSHTQQVTAQLVTQVPIKARISFPTPSKTVNQATIVEVIYSFSELKYGMTLEKTLRFSNIPIAPTPDHKPLAFRIHKPLTNVALRPKP